jgi:hypothetical protein
LDIYSTVTIIERIPKNIDKRAFENPNNASFHAPINVSYSKTLIISHEPKNSQKKSEKKVLKSPLTLNLRMDSADAIQSPSTIEESSHRTFRDPIRRFESPFISNVGSINSYVSAPVESGFRKGPGGFKKPSKLRFERN